jgi:microcystin-dependent protein
MNFKIDYNLILLFIIILLAIFTLKLMKINNNIEHFNSDIYSIKSFDALSNVYINRNNTITFANMHVTGDISGNLSSLKGIICAWSGSINTIPPGWALCDGSGGTPNLRGRFILGHNTNTGYNGNVDSSGNTIIRNSNVDSSGNIIIRNSNDVNSIDNTIIRNSNDVSGAKVGNNLAGVIGNVGGEIMHILTVDELPSHTHDAWAESCSNVYETKENEVTGDDEIVLVRGCPLNGGGFQWTGDYHVNRATTATGNIKKYNILPPFYILAYIIKL